MGVWRTYMLHHIWRGRHWTCGSVPCVVIEITYCLLCTQSRFGWVQSGPISWCWVWLKALKLNSLGETADTSSDSGRGTQCLAKIDIELTFTKRDVFMPWDPFRIRQDSQEQLRDSAFQPKTYTIGLEKGIFRTPCYAIHPERYPYTDKYALRLVFDKSPYPPLKSGGQVGSLLVVCPNEQSSSATK